MKKLSVLLFALVVFSIISPLAYALESEATCAVYFTGIGCPHCAKTDPVILGEQFGNCEKLVIIEYEIYQQRANGPLLYEYNSVYNTGFGIPLLIYNADGFVSGDRPILDAHTNLYQQHKHSKCPLLTGLTRFEDINFNNLYGFPNIWAENRVLVSLGNPTTDSELLKELMLSCDISKTLEGESYKTVDPTPIPYSGKSVEFDNAIEVTGWRFQWNGKAGEDGTGPAIGPAKEPQQQIKTKLSIPKILSLAAVDAINPCALAVLSLMLIAIITYNPKNKRNILLAGLAFTFSVFVMYLIYGIIIIRSFQLIQAITSIRLILYKVLGAAAILLGILNIKDFFRYTPGSLGTEMPMAIRPVVKKMIKRVTSPKGAFVVGIFVTVFLLPCTIGPYVIAGGILSSLELMKTIPWLLIYNFIFVLPMIFITGAVYLGMTKVQDVSGWKDKNIRWLHLIAGIIILGLGIAMLLGWV